MRISGIAACVLLCAGALGAQPLGLIQNPPARRSLSLNGSWNYLMDPYEAGYFDFHLNPIPDGGLGSNREPAGKSDKYELAFLANTPTLQVPGDWNTQKPELLWYEGTVWYRRTFDAPASLAQPSHRQFLWFGAANYQAVVFLNGKKIGEHEGGFTPFQFEVTGQLKERGNALIVKVDDKRHSDAIPPTITDWWNYGGLTRDVKLIDEPETYVEDYFVQLEKGSRSRVAGWVRVNGSRKQQKVAIRIPEAGAGATVETDANGYARFEFPATLTLWAPENPKLYDVSIEGETDGVQDRIGFRSIEVSGQKILLNGKPVFLRGISMHAEAPFRAGRVFSEADARTLLGWAKELGCNFVRLAHYPHDEVMARLADEIGSAGVVRGSRLLGASVGESRRPTPTPTRQLTEMITRDKNRASIILWSMANETPLGDARTKFISNLAAQARELDSTRLITAATLPALLRPPDDHYRRSAGQVSGRAWLQRVHRLVRRRGREARHDFVQDHLRQAAGDERIRRRSPRTATTAMRTQRGPKNIRPTSTATNWRCCSGSVSAGDRGLDPDGLPLPSPFPQRHSGLLQPQRPAERPRREEGSVLHPARLLSIHGEADKQPLAAHGTE